MSHQTREEWLEAFVAFWSSHSEKLGYPLPPVKVSCGWPARGALSEKRPKYGDCWPFEASEQGYIELFISPLLSDPVQVLATLIHQLGYACVGKKEKAKMKAYIQAVGLVGKPNDCGTGPELEQFLQKNLEQFGPYPHARIDPDRIKKEAKASAGRFLKAECPECKYTIRTTAKWLKVGLPTCPCSTKMVGPDIDSDGEIILPEAA